MSKLELHTPQKYLIACRTKKQAVDLCNRLGRYWYKLEGRTFTIIMTKYPLMLEAPLKGDQVKFISVHAPDYISSCRGFKGKIVYGEDLDRWLDEKETTQNAKTN